MSKALMNTDISGPVFLLRGDVDFGRAQIAASNRQGFEVAPSTRGHSPCDRDAGLLDASQRVRVVSPVTEEQGRHRINQRARLDEPMPSLKVARQRHSLESPDEPHNDSLLVSAARSGNPDSATSLYDRVRPVVERTVSRLLGRSHSDFADMVQIAMIELIRSLGRFRGECSLDTWTSTISANVVYKHIRRRCLENRIFSRELAPEDVTHSSTQNPVMHGMVEQVFNHLQQMSPERAWAFLLHDVHGYTLDEVAKITGASVAAAQSRLMRGRRELHDRIASDPDLAGVLDAMGNAS
jgi:RNA polymerase sigma-70 factor (ECF subfamily)